MSTVQQQLMLLMLMLPPVGAKVRHGCRCEGGGIRAALPGAECTARET
jgi:hypothetical protein